MFILGNLLEAVATVLDVLLMVYMYILIARALVSWVNPDPYNPIVRFLYGSTEPLLMRIRRFVPIVGFIDLSAMIAVLGIIFLRIFLVGTLEDFALRLR